jgi:group I intron endonuclease
MIIYKITNKINGKIYIGQTTKPIEERWRHHCKTTNKRSCRLMLYAIKKYGPENFSVEVQEICDSKDHLNKREKYWIKEFESFGKGYNLTSGGDHVELAEETKRKISEKLVGRPRTDGKGFRKGNIPWNSGISWSDDMKAKLSKAHEGQVSWCKGKKLTKDHRNKMSEVRKGKPRSDKYKPVICVTTGKIYPSGKHAAAELGLQTSKICLVLKGKRNHTGGFKFEYFSKP